MQLITFLAKREFLLYLEITENTISNLHAAATGVTRGYVCLPLLRTHGIVGDVVTVALLVAR